MPAPQPCCCRCVSKISTSEEYIFEMASRQRSVNAMSLFSSNARLRAVCLSTATSSLGSLKQTDSVGTFGFFMARPPYEKFYEYFFRKNFSCSFKKLENSWKLFLALRYCYFWKLFARRSGIRARINYSDWIAAFSHRYDVKITLESDGSTPKMEKLSNPWF